jgi:hypothetical protein
LTAAGSNFRLLRLSDRSGRSTFVKETLDMRTFAIAAIGLSLLSSVATAAGIRGQYIEARTCDVYTGPCFANAEMALAGKEAVLAWKVEEGGWNGTSLEGLSVALVLKAESTLGDDGVFEQDPGHIASVIVVDEQASPDQEAALVAFVKDAAADYTADVRKVERAAVRMENDYYSMRGTLKAGRFAEIETRALGKGDCVCTNEAVFYQPLLDVQQAMPAYSLKQSYTGKDLGGKWDYNNTRSAFLATFRR